MNTKEQKAEIKETKAKKKISPEELLNQLLMPKRTAEAFDTLEKVKKAFSLPVTLGCKENTRLAMDSAFESIGGFDSIYQSLQQHAFDMGQFPVTSFVGYGALQQIAQQGMVRACISTVADDMSKKWIELKGGEDTDPDKISKLDDLIKNKYHLQSVFHEAFTTTGYMGGCFIFIDTGSDELDLPLAINNQSAEIDPEHNLKFILVDPVNISPAEYNAFNPLASDYMNPKYWYVLGKKVHKDRLLRIVDNEPPLLLKPNYNFLGIPQAQILWDYILHFNECRTYTAKLLQKISLLVVKTDMDAILNSDSQGIAFFDAKMAMLARYRDNDSIFVCDKNSEDVTNVQTTVAGCTDIVKQSLEMICAINRVPAVKLLGISPSGFNATGESDLKNYYDHISSKQELHRDAIQRCINAIERAEFGEIDPSITFDFVALDVENRASQAMTAQTKVGAWGQLLDRQVLSAEELREAVKKDQDIGLDFIDSEMPEELQQAQAQALQNGEQEDFKTDDPFTQMMNEAKNEKAENSESNRAESVASQNLSKEGSETSK